MSMRLTSGGMERNLCLTTTSLQPVDIPKRRVEVPHLHSNAVFAIDEAKTSRLRVKSKSTFGLWSPASGLFRFTAKIEAEAMASKLHLFGWRPTRRPGT
ncbi:hypothetical protein K443DRAFT_501699 [Laccaria amethystina LaAM-08-1]|uniref:Uncharacterized protein n=1 Tax=Laccaria amethystina LaAM-08-1 TaxID=1095629 RepID=A0A0C9WUM3_9AGAR|nr:hypothetical protein K443DRAFT_501699 [Laccaria amethystina LaAM-08-1]